MCVVIFTFVPSLFCVWLSGLHEKFIQNCWKSMRVPAKWTKIYGCQKSISRLFKNPLDVVFSCKVGLFCNLFLEIFLTQKTQINHLCFPFSSLSFSYIYQNFTLKIAQRWLACWLANFHYCGP